jgi:Mn2+/Fe2+ NRAMP family transporter
MLAPLRPADLPEKQRSFWQLVGPGAVLVGLAIGAGELIVWPRLTALYGAGMTWAALLGVLLQLAINVEVGRYTLATGESIFSGYVRLSRHWAAVFLVLTVACWLLPGWARTCGGALKALIVGPDGPGSPWVWTAATFAVVAAVLFGPKAVYGSLERVTEAMVCIILAGLLVIAAAVGTAADWGALAAGAVNAPWRHPDMPPYALFAAIVFAGAGGTANLFYSFYLRDKGWGMGHRMPRIVNPLRQRQETGVESGWVPPDTPENRRRWRAWFRHLVRDQVLFFWLLNTVTILLFIFGALAVLHARAIVPGEENLVWDEAAILGSIWGGLGRRLFLVIGLACLLSTQLTLVDGVARSIADIVHTAYPAARARSTSWWYGVSAATWMVLGCLLTWLWERLPAFVFLLSAGFFGGIAMAIYCPLTLLVNHRLLPPALRPGRAWLVVLAAVSAFYAAFAVVSVVVVLRQAAGG